MTSTAKPKRLAHLGVLRYKLDSDGKTPVIDTSEPPKVDAEKTLKQSPDIFAAWKEYSLKRYQDDEFKVAQRTSAPPKKIGRVAIVGAGCAGLHAAMEIKEKFGADIPVDIIEANDRIGGRLYTHHFKRRNEQGARVEGGPYDYFDVGAMRFPDTPTMASTFQLFDKLGMRNQNQVYTISNDEAWLHYNGRRQRRGDLNAQEAWVVDPFQVGKAHRGSVHDNHAKLDPRKLLRMTVNPFIAAMAEDKQATMKELVEDFDHYSTRSYMSTIMGYPPALINWIETATVGTGWFDRGFVETIMEEVAFMHNQGTNAPAVQWKCVDGGSEKIPLKMATWLDLNTQRTKIHRQHRVTSVQFNAETREFKLSGRATPSGIDPSPNERADSPFKRTYSHVILAIPPPCIRMIDVSTCELDHDQRNALRHLQLAPSSKIGMKFKTAWWTTKNGIRGGQTMTDRVPRTIVYPSHGTPEAESTVLIVSYAWTQDSMALGAMMHGRDSIEEDLLKELMLSELADIHQIPLAELQEQYEDMYAFDWSHNSLSMGAFGLFGPGQFRKFYRQVTRPAARGQLYFAGEAFSTTHGWVAGALNSVNNVIRQIVWQQGRLNAPNIPELARTEVDPMIRQVGVSNKPDSAAPPQQPVSPVF